MIESDSESPILAEQIWRESCWEFLSACFRGARPGVIRELASAMFECWHEYMFYGGEWRR